MKKSRLALLLALFSNLVFAHDIHYEKMNLKKWNLNHSSESVFASFYFHKDKIVYLEDVHSKILQIPLSNLSTEDQAFVLKKTKWIQKKNAQMNTQLRKYASNENSSTIKYLIVAVLIICVGSLLMLKMPKNQLGYILPLIALASFSALAGFTQKSMQTNTSPIAMDSAFAPFKPAVHTFWDSVYFYVESKGIPTTHPLMVGISNHGWQQQVPIPQCYIGNNSWPVPLHPIFASSPIPVDSIHFTRGAIAIAVNGVAIFNVHTNTGVDSYLDGQLDNYGGHCGRADDYHYHIAPLHLYNFSNPGLPIAYGLDGFGVYGSVEPDGSAMQPLDLNHGHTYNGNYHYHGTAIAPYMIARMAGQVTEDSTHQLIPQSKAKGIRPALTPLSGALITSCLPNAAGNGYTMIYTHNGQTDSIVYSWTTSGQYTFKFYTAGNGTFTTSNYNGFTQCSVPTVIAEVQKNELQFSIYPNPVKDFFYIKLQDEKLIEQISKISIYNIEGKEIYTNNAYGPLLNIPQMESGVYLVRINVGNQYLTKKIAVQ